MKLFNFLKSKDNWNDLTTNYPDNDAKGELVYSKTSINAVIGFAEYRGGGINFFLYEKGLLFSFNQVLLASNERKPFFIPIEKIEKVSIGNFNFFLKSVNILFDGELIKLQIKDRLEFMKIVRGLIKT